MARANVITLLPLDRWAYHLGLNPRHFNQIAIAAEEVYLCEKVWLQYPWQYADSIAREEVAQAIAQAEYDLITLLGYSPLPQWIAGEVKRISPPWDVAAIGGSVLMTPAGRYKSVQANYGHIISGGVRQVDCSELGSVTIPSVQAQWFDFDGDLYFEILEITLPYTRTDTNEIRVYFEDESGNDEWEIKPLRSVVCDGVTCTIQIDRHLLVRPVLWEAIGAAQIDGMVDANFNQTLEVCRVYNDPSQQAQLQWERIPGECNCGSTSCAMCAWTVQWACLQTRDPKLGFLTYQPATWNATTLQYDYTQSSVTRQPERVRLWYRAGWQGTRVNRPMVQMDVDFERMITLYSICLLDRKVCTCSNVEAFYERYTEDRALQGEASYKMSNRDLNCPWGTKTGAIMAYQQAERKALGTTVRY